MALTQKEETAAMLLGLGRDDGEVLTRVQEDESWLKQRIRKQEFIRRVEYHEQAGSEDNGSGLMSKEDIEFRRASMLPHVFDVLNRALTNPNISMQHQLAAAKMWMEISPEVKKVNEEGSPLVSLHIGEKEFQAMEKATNARSHLLEG